MRVIGIPSLLISLSGIQGCSLGLHFYPGPYLSPGVASLPGDVLRSAPELYLKGTPSASFRFLESRWEFFKKDLVCARLYLISGLSTPS